MNLRVELADGTTKTISISRTSTTQDAVKIIAKKIDDDVQRKWYARTQIREGSGSETNQMALHIVYTQNGLDLVADNLSEFSLAHRDGNSESWINVSWLDPTLPLLEQGVKNHSSATLLCRKKYFSKNEDLQLLDTSAVLLRNIYSQLRHTFTAGLYKCSPFQAVQIAAMAAKVEFSGTRLGVAGALKTADSLKQILPPKVSGIPGVQQLIVKATKNISHLSERETQKAFIHRLQRLETFGLAFFTVAFDRLYEGLLGIGAENIYKIDREEMESLAQWEIAHLTNYYSDGSSFTMVFGSEEVTVATTHGHMISEFLSGISEVVCKSSNPLQNGVIEVRRGSDQMEQDRHGGHQLRTPSPNVPPPRVPRKPRLKSSQTQPELGNLKHQKQLVCRKQSLPDTELSPPPPSPLSKKPLLPPKPKYRVMPTPTASSTQHVSPIPKPPHSDTPAQPSVLSPFRQEPVEYLTPVNVLTSVSPDPHHTGKDTPSDNGREYATPSSPSGALSRQRGGRNIAVKRRQKFSPPPGWHISEGPPPPKERPPPPPQERPSPPPRPLAPPSRERAPPPSQKRVPPPQKRAPPPPQEKAPPPPQEKAPPPPQEKPPPPPQERASPSSQIESAYATVGDDPVELSEILGDPDLAKQVRWSQHDENPIYDEVAATEAQTLLRNSDVTFKSLNESFKRQLECRDAKGKSPSPVFEEQRGGMRVSPSPLKSTERLLTSSGQSNPQKVSGITKLGTVEMTNMYEDLYSDAGQRESQSPVFKKCQKQLPPSVAKKTPLSVHPQITRIGTTAKNLGRGGEGLYTNPEEMHMASNGIQRHRLHSDSFLGSNQRRVRVEVGHNEVDGVNDGAMYTIPENTLATGVRRRLKSEGDMVGEVYPVKPVEGVGAAEVGEEWEIIEPQKVDLRPPKPPRIRKKGNKEPLQKVHRQVHALEESGTTKQKARMMKPGEILEDYATLLKEFRIFFIKLPTGVVHIDMANLNAPVHKLIGSLCVLLCAEDPNQYSLYVEGAALTNLRESSSDGEQSDNHFQSSGVGRGPASRARSPKNFATSLEHFTAMRSYTILPDQGQNPILLDPNLSFRDHGIMTTRILALRPKPGCAEELPRHQIRVPDWVRFHQCWLSVVQGSQPCSLQDAVKLAALQYQAYFLDRSEINSIIGFCKSTEFLPLEYVTVKGVEEKVFSEQQQQLKGYTRKQAQDCYIHASCSLPTYGSVFFPCKELKKRVLQNNKLTPILIGISREGISRVDAKTKETLDMWQYQVLQNWGFSPGAFVLNFADTSYPVKTNQGRWINNLINFHIEAITRDEGSPPPPPKEAPLSTSPPPPLSSRQMNAKSSVERIYEELLSPTSPPLSAHPSLSPLSPTISHSPHDILERTSSSSSSPTYHVLECNAHHSVAPITSPSPSEERVYDLPTEVINELPLKDTASSPSRAYVDDIYDDVVH